MKSYSQLLRFIILVVFYLICSETAQADVPYTYKGTTLNYTELWDETKTCAVSSAPQGISGDVHIPSYIKINDTSYRVTNIISGAFQNCTEITSIYIPDTVKNIGGYAFKNCSKLISINIPEGPTTLWSWFSGCTNLKSVRLPNTLVTSNGTNFYKCHSLESVELPSSLTNIGTWEFRECYKLKEIKIPNSVTNIGDWAFYQCYGLKEIKIPNSVTEIALSVFEDCTGLVSAELPENLSEIKRGLFDGCTSLASVNIPNSVQNIGEYAFNDCQSLRAINFPTSVKNIGLRAFQRTGLQFVNIPNSVDTIDVCAFYECNALTSVELPGNIRKINAAFDQCPNIETVVYHAKAPIEDSSYCFDYTVYQKATLYLPTLKAKSIASNINPWKNFKTIKKIGQRTATVVIYKNKELKFEVLDDYSCSLTDADTNIEGEFEIPNEVLINGKSYTVTEIDDEAFAHCSKLTKVTIPNTVQTIGSYVFYVCDNLKSAVVPKSVTTIGSGLFSNCKQLTAVSLEATITHLPDLIFSACNSLTSYTVPNGITRIGAYAFAFCENLHSVNLPESVTRIEDAAFDQCIKLSEIRLPKNCRFIGNYAFRQCNSLQKVSIPALTDLWYTTFYNCANLKEIIFEGDITNFGGGNFNKCYAITDITYNTDKPLEVTRERIFEDAVYSTARLWFPSQAGVDAAKETEPWKRFLNIGIIGDSALPEVEADTTQTDIVSIYNMQGVKVYEGAANAHSLANGMYIVVKGGNAAKVWL